MDHQSETEVRESEESSLTVVASLTDHQPEEVCNPLIDSITATVKMILEELASDFRVINDNHDMSEEDYNIFKTSASQVTEEAAAKIVQLLTEELNLKTHSEAELEPEALLCWKRVETQIKASFIHTFARESILSIVENLKKKLGSSQETSGNISLKQLLDCVDWMLEDLIRTEPPKTRRQMSAAVLCLYHETAKEVSYASDQQEHFASRLRKTILKHLAPDHNSRGHFAVTIDSEVDAFLRMMWIWLMEQSLQSETESDRGSAALRILKKEVENLTNCCWQVRGEASSSLSESAIVDEADEDACATITLPGQEWDKLCESVLRGILIHGQDSQSVVNTDVLTKLKSQLLSEIAGCSTAVQLSERNIKKISKAVRKDMHKNISRNAEEWTYLLTQDTLGCGYIAESLKKHLMKPPKKSNVKTFFTTMYRVMSKPYKTPFTV